MTESEKDLVVIHSRATKTEHVLAEFASSCGTNLMAKEGVLSLAREALILGFDENLNCFPSKWSLSNSQRAQVEQVQQLIFSSHNVTRYCLVTVTLPLTDDEELKRLSALSREEKDKVLTERGDHLLVISCDRQWTDASVLRTRIPGTNEWQGANIVLGPDQFPTTYTWWADFLRRKVTFGSFDEMAYMRARTTEVFKGVQMNQHEVKRFMKDEGFWEKRVAKSGIIWTDGLTDVMVAHSISVPRVWKNIKADVARARKQREELAKKKAAPKVEPPKPIPPSLQKARDAATAAMRIAANPPPPPPPAPEPPKPEPRLVTEIVAAPPSPDEERKKRHSLALTYKRFDDETRKTVRRQIWRLYKAGFSYREIAERLEQEKAPRANADVPWSENMIANHMSSINRERDKRILERRAAKKTAKLVEAGDDLYVEPAVEPAPPPPPALPPPPRASTIPLPASLALMMEDPELTTSQKVAALRAIAPKLPASVTLMLEDAELTDDQRFAALSVLLGIRGPR